jgi:prevent-host-death family protein
MKFSLDEAQAQLDELVRRAQDGEDIVPTRAGEGVAHIFGAKPKRRLSPEERMAIIREVQAMAKDALPGPSAECSQDFLYDEHGLQV